MRYFDQSEMATYSVADSVSGDTFYVDPVSGSDSNNGLSPSTAFKTLYHCFDRYRSNNVIGGDVVKLFAGIYRENIGLTMVADQYNSLTESTPLIVGPYGNGEVIIDPSTQPINWTAYDSNIYVADWPHPTYGVQAVVIDDDFKSFRPKKTLVELTSFGLWYYDSANKKIYVHNAGVDPSTQDTIFLFDYDSAEHYCIKTNGYNYLKFYGLTLRGASRYGFSDYKATGRSIGNVVEKCTVKFNHGNGIRFFGEYGTIRKCHIWANMMYNWPRGSIYGSTGGWGQGATIINNGLAEGNISHDNGGEGIGVYGGDGYTVFQDNISYDNWSVGLYLDNAAACTFRRNLVYAHNPDVSDICDIDEIPAGSTYSSISGRLRQEGIMVGDESATYPVARSAGFSAYDNIIIGCRRGILTYGQATGSGLVNYTIVGNTIVMPDEDPLYGDFSGFRFYPSVNNTGSVIKNNIVYSYADSGHTQPLVAFGAGTMSGVDWDNNLYFSINDQSEAFKSGSYPNEILYNFSGWIAYVPSGFDANSIFDDPLFVGNNGSFTATDYLLNEGSPAIDEGATIAEIERDFRNLSRTAPYDIGAMESGAVPVFANVTPSAPSGRYTETQDVTLSCDDPTSTIKYATSLVDPNPIPNIIYSGSFKILQNIARHYFTYNITDADGNISDTVSIDCKKQRVT